MNGIVAHNATIQWLYELLDSPFRLVVKTALKLLLVFIEYNDNNSLLPAPIISTSPDLSKERKIPEPIKLIENQENEVPDEVAEDEKPAAESLKSKPLIINDLDFSEFHADEYEQDPLVMARQTIQQEKIAAGGGFIPPPPGSIPLPPRCK
ncbi:unnamed protein product, partial [Mesorhabditis spiculigera]